MTNEVAIEILEMLKIRPRRGSSMIIAQTAVNVALQTGINALYEKKDRIEKADNDLSSELEQNSKKLEKGNDLAVDCNNCKNNCYRGDETSYCATGDGMCHYECEETTKNDLVVDWDELKRKILMEVDGGTDDKWLRYADVCDRISGSIDDFKADLPSITPQPKKGHWIKIGDRGFGYSDIVICKCSECEYQTEFVGKFDRHNLVIDAEYADNYCSNCGADMRGEECQKKKSKIFVI